MQRPVVIVDHEEHLRLQMHVEKWVLSRLLCPVHPVQDSDARRGLRYAS
eukprot:CAMPEP_0181170556 /NCGR_PEP_ID=MMETSP1096-20121128/1428_1 /TAXON_ID=156174 ORGANISM="Chrysochromulina ericina, Strain CCMP281" /NCGR_SAMPLE_ID=MMETSP1096 /ASSEMBLY_ACC=CAM_ASM_000453 /LENGTH=48 /DNA_ID= /DNA_START= /DNA_END= /DNA_ORIENTATION=